MTLRSKTALVLTAALASASCGPDGWPERPWNCAHVSDGCDLLSLWATGGAGEFYCSAEQ